jgi:hypothetical protein
MDLDATNPGQVSSWKVLDADLGVGNRHLLVISGIAICDWRVDTDGLVPGEWRVKLGVYARNLEQASAFVGLASVANDDSEFTFACDAARLDPPDPDTGELSLIVNSAVQGEWSSLNRFGFQVVATIVRTGTFIDGTISWPTGLRRPSSNDPSTVAPYLRIVANKYKQLASGGVFGSVEKLTPLVLGAIESLTVARDMCRATYRIDNPPMAEQLKVTLTVSPDFAPAAALLSGRIAGPDNFALSPSQPSMTVDFGIDRTDVS